jgi:hypothetical protein
VPDGDLDPLGIERLLEAPAVLAANAALLEGGSVFKRALIVTSDSAKPSTPKISMGSRI